MHYLKIVCIFEGLLDIMFSALVIILYTKGV